MKRVLSVMAAALLGATLAACGTADVADDRYGGIPKGVPLPSPPDGGLSLGEPFAAWVEPDEVFAVVTFGSSSCPATAASIDVTGEASVIVTFASPSGSGPCTADMAPTTHEFAVPSGADGRPLEVTIAWEDYDSTQVSVLE